MAYPTATEVPLDVQDIVQRPNQLGKDVICGPALFPRYLDYPVKDLRRVVAFIQVDLVTGRLVS